MDAAALRLIAAEGQRRLAAREAQARQEQEAQERAEAQRRQVSWEQLRQAALVPLGPLAGFLPATPPADFTVPYREARYAVILAIPWPGWKAIRARCDFGDDDHPGAWTFTGFQIGRNAGGELDPYVAVAKALVRPSDTIPF